MLTVLKDFINSKKIYFIIIFCILNIIGFFVFEKNKSTSVAGMMKEADNFAKRGQIAYAIENYNRIVKVFPNNYEAHIRLAELYLGANESILAKVEYVKAIKLGYKSEYKANTALAEIYINEGKYNLAEEYIKAINYKNNIKAQQAVGDFYFKWGESLKENNKPEAVRKFKFAYKYYKNSKSPNLLKLKKNIKNVYIELSDEFLESKNYQDAISILKTSLAFWNNAETHYRLAKIYEKQEDIDNALAEYKKAFELNPKVASSNGYVQLLIKKAEFFASKGDMVSKDLYYTLAKKLDKNTKAPVNTDIPFILNIFSARCNQNIDKDILIPEIILKINNITKEKISNLKIKILFSDNGKFLSEEVKIIATEKNPLKADSITDEIKIFTSKPVEHVFDKHDLRVQIYISQKTPDEWVLFRNTNIAYEKDSNLNIIE